MCDVQIILHKNKKLIKKLIRELMIEKLICPIESIACKKLYYNEKTEQLEIDKYSTHQCIFFPSKYVDFQEFQLKTDFDLRELMSFNDFSKFLIIYAKKQNLSLDNVFSEEFHDLSILYFFDKSLYKKYARKQAEKFLEDTMIIIENNQLHFTKKNHIDKIYKLNNMGMIKIPASWFQILNVENEIEITLTYNEIKLTAIRN